MTISIDTLLVFTSVAIIALILICTCILLAYTKSNLDNCKAFAVKPPILDGELLLRSRHRIVSKQKRQELDTALGLVTVKTKITKDLYDATIGSAMHELNTVEQAALRYVIESYKASLWIDAKAGTPQIGRHVWGYCKATEDYLCVTVLLDGAWMIVEHDDKQVEMPPHLVITHWKNFDGII